MTSEKFVLSLDAGTTSCRCFAFDHDGSIRSSSFRGYGRTFPSDGYVEQDASEIWHLLKDAISEVLEDIGGSSMVDSIGVTNQRETVVIWDRMTGVPVHPAIVWQCRRTASYCDELRRAGYEDHVRSVTGLVLDPYFSATKIKWILDNVDGARLRAENGDLLFGNIDTWIIWNLTRGESHVTDYSNASRTMLFDIRKLVWDDELLDLMNIPREMLPDVLPSSFDYGCTTLFGGSIPVCGDAGDQQSSLFGQGCFRKGDAKNTYGTGCFMLMNTGDRFVSSDNRLLTTIAWGLDGKVTYALEGSVFDAGASVDWFRDLVGLKQSADIEDLAEGHESAGCFFVPAFEGLGAPYWDPYARAVLCGVSSAARKENIARAVLEGVALLSADVFDSISRDAGHEISLLKVDGGMSRNDLFLQIQADVLDVAVTRSGCRECTARGAAFLAGLRTGYWTSIRDLPVDSNDRVFSPEMSAEKRESLRSGWRSAVGKAAR